MTNVLTNLTKEPGLVFGIDIGIGRIGIAVAKDGSIYYLGVKVFDPATEAQKRRLERALRRSLFRTNWRYDQLKKAFVKYSLVPKAIIDLGSYSRYEEVNADLPKPADETVYHLRVRATKEQVSIREMYLCLYSILHARGHFLMEDIDFSKDALSFDDFKEMYYKATEQYVSIPEESKEQFEKEILEEFYNKKMNSKELKELCNGIKFPLQKKNDKKAITNIVLLLNGYVAKANEISDDLQFSDNNVSIEKLEDVDDCDDFFLDCEDMYSYIKAHQLLANFNYICESAVDKMKKYNEKTRHGKDSEEYKEYSKEIKEKASSKAKHMRSVRNFENKYPNGLYVKEALAILKKQQEYNPAITDAFIDACISVIKAKIPYYIGPLGQNSSNKWTENKGGFMYSYEYTMNQDNKPVNEFESVRAWKDRMISRCTYLPDERALPKGSFIGETFSIINELNISYAVDQDGNDYYLSREDKIKLFDQLILKGGKAKWGDIAELLNLKSFGNRSNTNPNSTLKTGYSLYTKIAKIIPELKLDSITELFTNPEKIEKIEHIILSINLYNEPKVKKDYFTNEMKLPEETVKELVRLKSNSFYSFSKQLLMEIPMDKSGNCLMEQLFENNTSEFTNEQMTRITNAVDLNGNSYDFSANKYEKKIRKNGGNMDVSLLLEDGRNVIPISRPVIRGLNEAMKLYLKLVEVFGVPDRLIIETARNLKDHTVVDEKKEKVTYGKTLNAKMKALYEHLETKRNKKENELAKKTPLESWDDLEAKFDRHKLKVELYIRQNGLDLITGKPINIANLKDYEVDHILPVGFGDDSKDDKMLIHKNVNSVKGDRLPLQYIKDGCFVDGKEVTEEDYTQRVEMLYSMELISEHKRKILLLKTPNELEGFINQNLTDTRYIIREFMAIVRAYNKVHSYGTHIVALKSAYTSLFRRAFNMEKNRNYGHQHHAHDAALLIVADRTLSYYYPHYDERKLVKKGEKTSRYDDLIKQIVSHDVKGQADLNIFLRNAFLKAYGMNFDAPDSIISQIKRTVPFYSTKITTHVEKFFEATIQPAETFKSDSVLSILGINRKDRVFKNVNCVAADFFKLPYNPKDKEQPRKQIAILIPAAIVHPDGSIDKEKYMKIVKEKYNAYELIDENGNLRTEFYRFRLYKNDLVYNTSVQELFQFGVGCIENQKLNFYHVNIFSYNQIYNLGSEIAADLIRRFNLRTRQNKNGVKFSEVDKDAMVDYVAEAYYHIKPTVKKPKKPKPQKPVEGKRAKKPKTTPVATVKEAVKKQKNIYDFSNCLAYYANIINRPATTVKIENRYVAEVHVKELNRHEDGEYVKIKTGLLGIRFKKSGKNAKIVAPKEAEGEFSLIKREEFNWKVNY